MLPRDGQGLSRKSALGLECVGVIAGGGDLDKKMLLSTNRINITGKGEKFHEQTAELITAPCVVDVVLSTAVEFNLM